MIPGGFDDWRILQAVEDHFTKMFLANFQQITRAQPIYRVNYQNEAIFEVLMTYQSRTKVLINRFA